MKGMNLFMEHWMKRRIIVTCPICNRKFNLLGIKHHIKGLHWNASDDFLRKWEISDDYIKLSKEERYYKYRPERNPYRFLVDDDAMVLKRWFLKKKEAKSRDIMFVLTFEDYCKLIYDAGIKSSDIGWGKTSNGNHYVLGRYHDLGPYAVGNCRFITQSQNIYEARINKKARRGIYTKNDGTPYKPGGSGGSLPTVNPPKEERFCKICGAPIDKRAAGKTKLCRECFLKENHVISMEHRPNKDTLIKDLIDAPSISEIGRKYHVNQSTIADWCIDYDITNYMCYIHKYRDAVNDDGKVIGKFTRIKNILRDDGIEFNLSLKEFCKLLYVGNIKSSDLGNKRGKYILCRMDESKPYDFKNCKFIEKIGNERNAYRKNQDVIDTDTTRCKYCGTPINKQNKLSVCRDCFYLYKLNNVKVKDKPSRDDLKSLIRKYPFLKIGKKYGVSDNSIRKWCKSYNLPYKSSVIRNITDADWETI